MHNAFGEAQYIDTVSALTLKRGIESATQSKPEAILILCCDQGTSDRDTFDTVLTSSTTPIFGGIFPSIVYQGASLETGMLIISIHVRLEIKTFNVLQDCNNRKFDLHFDKQGYDSLLVLIDGLSRNIDNAINQIFNAFGQSLQIFGGGAGSLSFEKKPCLFTPNGMLQDAMIIVAMQQEFSLAIGHGWDVLDGPFIANQVDDNKIIQLNFQPALDVYSEVIESNTGISIDKNTFFETCATFPFGIERLDGDVLVRDPITLDNTTLVCVGTVPQNTMLYVLKGANENLINAAHNSITELNITSPNSVGLLFDCIGRKIFLQQDFDKEIQSISHALGLHNKLFGALVLGEIASNKMGCIDLHNKTAVTAVATQHV